MDLLREWRDKYSADTEICVKTNGEGPRVLEVLSRVPGDVMVRRSPKEYVIEDFYGYNIAPVDLPLYRLFADFSAGCFIPRNCGIGLNKYGYYTCGNGAGVARVFGMDIARQELPDETDEMRDQMKALCGYCGAFHHFISIMRPKDPFYVSETWSRAFEAYKRAKPELPEWKAR